MAAFIAVRVVVGLFLRQHFLAPITVKLPLAVSNTTGRFAHAWWIASYVTDPRGHSSQTGIAIPPACQLANFQRMQSCLAAHGDRRLLTYQPAERFWTFQAIEAGICALLAVVALGVAFWRITTADA